MKKILVVSFGVLVCLSSAAAEADGQRPWSINQRQENQQRRIDNGAANGSVTKAEYARLEKQQYRIETREQRMRESGGTFTLKERARVQHSLNRASGTIYRQKHDRQGNLRP